MRVSYAKKSSIEDMICEITVREILDYAIAITTVVQDAVCVIVVWLNQKQNHNVELRGTVSLSRSQHAVDRAFACVG